MMISYDLKVDIWDINIDQRYYDFQYKIYMRGKVIAEGEYQSDHDWGDDIESFRKLLIDDDYALSLALEQIN